MTRKKRLRLQAEILGVRPCGMLAELEYPKDRPLFVYYEIV